MTDWKAEHDLWQGYMSYVKNFDQQIEELQARRAHFLDLAHQHKHFMELLLEVQIPETGV